LKNGKGSISPHKIIKALERCKFERTIVEPVLIHTDNGPEFTNYDYYTTIENDRLFAGSTSHKGHCEHNSVVESAIRTIKIGMTKIPSEDKSKIEIPKVVGTTQECEIILRRRVKYYNEVYTPKYNGKLNCEEKEKKAENSMLVLPDVILAHNDTYGFNEVLRIEKNFVFFKVQRTLESAKIREYHKNLHEEEQEIDATGMQGLRS
jgi:transposase InsO family protein